MEAFLLLNTLHTLQHYYGPHRLGYDGWMLNRGQTLRHRHGITSQPDCVVSPNILTETLGDNWSDFLCMQ